MPFLNVEIKARCSDPSFIRNYLVSKGAIFKGIDTQIDTYFNVSKGRMKLREGNIENNLIFYERNNERGPKNSRFHLIKVEDPQTLKEVLSKSNGLKVVVKKKREIYYIVNVKFHIDEVDGLGAFVEIEAGNILVNKTPEELLEQCEFFLKEFKIDKKDLVSESYSDLLECPTKTQRQ